MILCYFGIHIIDEQLPSAKDFNPRTQSNYIHDVLLHSHAWVTNQHEQNAKDFILDEWTKTYGNKFPCFWHMFKQMNFFFYATILAIKSFKSKS
jgi:hypothetical protein